MTFTCPCCNSTIQAPPDVPAGAAELMWHDSEKDALHNGLYLMFPDEFMAPGAADTDNQDLTVRTRNRK